MTEKNDGGPAFPYYNTVQGGTQEGMTLRDWFAGQALVGLCSGFTGSDGTGPWFEERGAKSAYRIADAMLEARK